MTKYSLLVVITLILITISGTSVAVTIDGIRSVDEWNESWAYGQFNGTDYKQNGPFGDKMVIFQAGNWSDEDPMRDSGTGFNENMATVGPYESGYDIKGIYARYDFMTDTLYGLCTVYGLPGDLDGDGDPYNSVEFSDTRGAITPNNVDGIGADEFFNIRLIQGDKATRISIQNNAWDVVDVGDGTTTLTATDIDAACGIAYHPINDYEGDLDQFVYEIKINGINNNFDISPGATLIVRVTAGAQDDRDPITGGLIGEDIADVFVTIPSPDIDLEKSTNGEDADNAPGPGIPEGENVTWTYVVTNTGDVPLLNISVIDDKLGPITNIIDQGDGDDILSIGESWIFEATGIAECGQYVNNATAVGFFDVIPVFDTDPSHYFGECPDIDIEKATNGEDADEAPGPGILQGATVTWTYVVNNTGNVPLSNISVIDDQGVIPVYQSGDVNEDAILDVDEIWVYEATGIAECGQYANNATVTGEYKAVIVTDEDPSHYFGECPSIDIEKATNGEDADDPTGPFIPVGDSVTWTYNVTNTGNVDLVNVTVTDNILGVISVIGDLAVGASTEVSANGVAVAGQYANIGNVTGDYNGITVTDEDPSHYFGASPSIDIEKATNGEDADDPTGPFIPVGDSVTWTYNVTNTGNVDLVNVTVTDNILGVISVIGDLAAGESTEVSANGVAVAGQYANIGNVTGDYNGITVTDEDPSHYFGASPSIDIEKTTNGEDADDPTGPFIPVGDSVTWTYNVTNTGNVDLVNVTVTDNILGVISVIGDLAVGASTEVSANGIAAAGQYANIGNVTGDYNGITVTDEDPSHYFGASPSIDIEKATNGEDADIPTGPFIPVGDSVTWTYNVTNTGNVDLVNVTVTDNILGEISVIGDLAVGASTEVSANGVAVAGQYANIGNVTGDYNGITVTDEDPSHYFGASPSIDIEKATNGEDADSPTGPFIPVGDSVTWTYNVTNTGNVDLVNVTVTDNLLGEISVIGDLAVGASTEVSANGIAVAGQYANIGNVTGDYNGITVTDEDPSHYFGASPSIDIEKATNGEDADSPTGPFIPVGDSVTWTYNVTNTGNVDLVNVTVTDNLLGEISVIGDLAAGESTEVSANGVAVAGQYANIGNVTGDYNGITVTDEDPSHYFGASPSIDIEKATNGEDADIPTGPFIPVGDSVTWTYNVTNTGNVDLVNVTVTDNILGVISVIGDLAAGESTEVSANGVAVVGQYANIGNVTGDYNGITVTDEDPSHYFGASPSIDIEKATNGEDADDPTGPFIPVGDSVTWTYNVTNTGNVDLVNVTVTDNILGEISVIGDLAVGASTEVSANGVAVAGQYANIGNVTGDYNGITVTDEDPSHYFGASPSIDIEKATNGADADDPTGPFIPVGDSVTWTYNVTNTGNVDLVNVTVTDNILGLISVIGDLAVGASTEVSANGVAVAGQYANIGNVTGDYNGITVTDEDPSHYFGASPSIDIEKATNGADADDPTGPFIPVGDSVTWTYNVTNTGNVDLVNVTVTDNILGLISVIGDLAVGASTEVSANGVAVAGQYANIGNVTGDYNGITVTDEDPSHYFGASPSIDIEKATNGADADDPTGPFIPVGDSVTWTYNVTNTGNVDLVNVTVTDNILGVISVIGDLAVGASTEVSANGVAVAGQYANIGNVTGDYNGITVTDEDPSHYFGASPSIDIEKATNGEDADSAPGPSLGIGDAVTWTYVVTNTGNVNLSNIVVTDDKLGVIGNIVNNGDGDGILSVGETWTYQATGSASCGQYANLGTVTGDYGSTTVNDSDPSHYNVVCAPNIDIEKSTNGFDADSAPGPTLAYGAEVTWEYVVRNTGNVHLTNITVTDDQLGTISNIVDKGNGDDTLMPGEVWIYQSTGTAECGQYANVGDVVGHFGSIPVTDSDPSHYRVNCVPDIDIEKYINGNDADQAPGILLAVGDSITWKFVVKNTGNVPLDDVVVVDDKLGTIPASSIISKSINNDDILDPGEVWTYELKGTVTECVPQHKNTAIVTGEFEGTEVSDEDVAHYYCQPVVPLLSPVGMMILISVLGLAGAFYLRRRD
ncbi:beta strand repeat-containing protein [Methanolobus sp. WCC5]|uniref:beta strand repeat-containing protein n=1 Tax=Methanolobus sp. WCC5 TaxID=3125785 RepID=UPI00324853F6